MPRTGLCFILCAGTLLGALPFLPAAPDNEQVSKKEILLGVQRALAKGHEYIRAGHYKAAVDILEKELPEFNVFENRDYLRALSDAYVGYIGQLKQANQLSEAAVYQRRLGKVDPGALLEVKGAFATAPATIPSTKSELAPAPVPVKPAGPSSLIPVASGVTPPSVTARGQVKEDDPFDDANSRGAQDAKELVERAEREFDAGHYDVSGKLFEQAERAVKGASGAARERWAYCKLHGVVSALNRQGAPAAQDLEREVRLALSMAPKLDSIGQDLLRRIKERQVSTPGARAPMAPAAAVEETVVEVRHTPRQDNTWAKAETTHFRIFHAQSQELAEKTARIAESTRLTAARKWFGKPLDAWSERCDIYLHNTADEYAHATEQSPRCPGHSTMPMEGERVLARRIDLHCDDPNMSIGVLPHEVTHVVLAGRFPRALPRWADEGMAVLSEPRGRIERHLRNLPMHAQQNQLFQVGQLLKFDKSYPDPQLVGPFYAQSVSVVEYLSGLRGPVVFSQFLAEGMRGNFETALRKHYSIPSFQELDTAWRGATLGDAQAARVAAQP